MNYICDNKQRKCFHLGDKEDYVCPEAIPHDPFDPERVVFLGRCCSEDYCTIVDKRVKCIKIKEEGSEENELEALITLVRALNTKKNKQIADLKRQIADLKGA